MNNYTKVITALAAAADVAAQEYVRALQVDPNGLPSSPTAAKRSLETMETIRAVTADPDIVMALAALLPQEDPE